jgi:hypothetical protein
MTAKEQATQLLKQIKTLLSSDVPRVFKFMAEGKTSEGVIVRTEADDWAEGVEVFVEVDGQVQVAPNGTHTLEDGTVLEVADGKVVTVTKVQVDEEMGKVLEQAQTALAKLSKDKEDFAKLATDKAAELVALSESHQIALSAKDAEIVALKAQITTLSAQVKSVQDGGGQAAPAKVEKTDAKGRPEGWAKMSTADRIQYNMDNISLQTTHKN